MLFGNLRKKNKPAALAGTIAMGERAERGGTPARTINSFADFARPDQTVSVVELEDYLPLLRGALDALQHEIGHDKASFDRLVMPMLRRYLSWVHLLPASASHHHARLGGLAIHGLDVATLAARNAHNAVLDFDPAYTLDLELRAHRRMLWPLAAATAGLHHDLGKVLVDQIVTCADTGEVWNPFVSDLLTWAKKQKVTRYAVRWRGSDRLHRHESFGLLLMGSIAGQDVLGELSGLGRDVIEAVAMSVSGEKDDPSGMRKMVHMADVQSCKLDRDSGQAYWSEGSVTSDPIVGRLMDMAASLVRKRIWKVNTPGHSLWVNNDGAYLIWPQAFSSLRQELVSTQNSIGIPNDPTEVAEIFLRARVAKPREFSNGQRVPLWSLHIPLGDKSDDDTSPFAKMMATLGGVSNALFIPEPGALISGIVIPEHHGLRIARDPTLPDTVESAPDASAASAAAASGASAATDVDGEAVPADAIVETLEHAEPAESPAAQPESAPVEHEAPGARASHRGEALPQTDSHTEGKAPTETQVQASMDAPPPPDDAIGAAMTLLQNQGPLGAVLARIADRIALEGDLYVSRDRLVMKGETLLLKWPDAVRGEVSDIRSLSDAIASDPSLLASSFNGQPVDVAGYGITISARVRGAAWNAVPLNSTISAAFNKVARRNAKPVATDIPS